MKLSFDTDELKEWVDTTLAFGIFKYFIKDHENLLEYLFYYIIAIVAQVLVLITAPISLIIVLLMAIKIRQ